MRKKSIPANVELFNAEGADMDFPYELTMTKKKSASRQEYDKRVLQISSRNSAINAKLGQIHGSFDKTYEANKLLLESQLKEVSAVKNSIIEKYESSKKEPQGRETKAKSIRSSCSDYSQTSSKQSMSSSKRRELESQYSFF